MATKATKTKRAAPRKRRRATRRQVWTRRDGEIQGPVQHRLRPRFDARPKPCPATEALKEAGCKKTFVEQMSGAVSDRPALREALDYARGGDTLIVWKLDPLARSMKQLIETIEKLRLRNIGFRSLTEAIDTTTAQGVLVFHMFSALAEFERALIRERTRAGLAAAKRAVRTGGRPPSSLKTTSILRARWSPIPISLLPMSPTGSGLCPPRCTDICPPPRRQTDLRPDSVRLPRHMVVFFVIDL